MKLMYMNKKFRGLNNKLLGRLRHTNILWYGTWKDTFQNRAKKIISDALARSYSYNMYKEKKDRIDKIVLYI